MSEASARLLPLFLAIGPLVAGCSSTDWLGWTEPSGPSPFEEVLGHPAAEVDAKLEAAYEALFHGDPDTQAIYFEAAPGEAYTLDVLHGEIRTDGIGYGMLVSAVLGRQTELDALWSYAKAHLLYTSGPRTGYLFWNCSGTECPDPNGMTYAATALLVADRRLGPSPAGHDYAGDGQALLQAMLHREEANGGIVADVHDIFDDVTGLPVLSPVGFGATTVVPSYMAPFFYELWAESSPDAEFWRFAAARARAYWPKVAHPQTGLVPESAAMDGTPLGDFGPEGYRFGIHLAMDRASSDPWQTAEADRLIDFFSGEGADSYVATYTLAGEPTATYRSSALIAANGALASISTRPERSAFLQAVWELPIPSGQARYYDGLLYLLALMVLGGKLPP